MGQEVNPVGMRVGVIRDWQSRWYADDKDFGTTLLEDVKIREFVNYYKKLSEAAADKRKKLILRSLVLKSKEVKTVWLLSFVQLTLV